MMRPLPSSSEGACSYGDGHAPIFRPTGSSSLQQFPGDTYSNIRKLSTGFRRLRGGRERYQRGDSEPTSAEGRTMMVKRGERERATHRTVSIARSLDQIAFSTVPCDEVLR